MSEYRDPLLPTRAMRQDIFSLAEGTASIQWPTPLSEESIQDLKDWLKIVERKITRSVETESRAKSEDGKQYGNVRFPTLHGSEDIG